MSNLAIITLSWNGREKLEKLYPTLLANLKEANIKWGWYIKSNNCSDGSRELIKSWNNPNVVLCEYPNNLQNFSEGCNYLVNIAQPKDDDYVLLLNNDIIFNDTFSIKNMIKCMEKDKDVGVVGARLLYTNTNTLQHAGIMFMPQYKSPFHFRPGQTSDVHAEKNRYFQAVTGALLLTKYEYYCKAYPTNPSGLPGLSESYKWSFCDVSFNLSIKYNLGKKILYCGKTNVFHEESASLKKNPVNKLFMNHNLDHFRNEWADRIKWDQPDYEKDPNYNLAE